MKNSSTYSLQDIELFNQDYTGTAAPENLADVAFALKSQPVTYVITLQVRQFYKLDSYLVTRHMTNLELTYGPETVESTIAMFFPNFHARYYGAE